MRKTNKNLTKQILTLMLAFVMVFTGMGIGSWGVDTAWADDEIPELTVTGGELKGTMKFSSDLVYVIEVEKGSVASGKNLTTSTLAKRRVKPR